jgi:hypothetical protein
MTNSSRIFRGILAASMLHLMLAVPVRACPAETVSTTSAAPQAVHEMAMPMSHADHDVAGMPVPPTDQSPDTDAPSGQHLPCCPSPASGCQGSACTSPVAAALVLTDEEAPSAPLVTPPSLIATRWVSYSHAPEPPPPRA